MLIPKTLKNKLVLIASVLLLAFGFAPDGFGQWVQTNGPYGGSRATSFAKIEENIFVGTSGGLFVTADNGKSWTKLAFPSNVRTLYSQNNYLFAATYYRGDYLSTNNGKSWVTIENGLLDSEVCAYASDSSHLFAAINDQYSHGNLRGGVFLSTNNGLSWSNVSDGLPFDTSTKKAYGVNAISIYGGFLFAGTDGAGIFRSPDNGSHWMPMNSKSLTSANVESFVSGKGLLFAGTRQGIFLSLDSGASWTNVSVRMSNHDVLSLSLDSINLFAGTFGGGIYRSTDSGATWTIINTGLKNYDVFALSIFDNSIFSGTDAGVFRSTNDGNYWIATDSGIANTDIIKLATSGSNLFAGTNGGVFHSNDDGASWDLADSGLTHDVPTYDLAVIGKNVFAATINGVFLSSDSGKNWHEKPGTSYFSVQSLTVSDTNLYAGTFNGGVFLSSNNGTTWKETDSDLKDTIVHTWVLALIVQGNNLYAGGYDNGVFLSTDNGKTWSPINNGLTSNFNWSFATYGKYVFTATGGGVFVTSDEGVSWKPVNNGLTTTNIGVLYFVGTVLFAGTGNGVFLTTDFGATWIPVNTGLTNLGVRSLITLDGFLFAGNGTGIVWRRPLSDFGINAVPTAIPLNDKLQSFPNPLSTQTTISFSNDSREFISVTIMDMLGKQCASLFTGELDAGNHSYEWDASHEPQGMYLCIIRANGVAKEIPMMVVR